MNKLKLTLIFLLLVTFECVAQQQGNSPVRQTVFRNGIGLGSVIAVVISWDRNKSVLFAVLHGILGWLYVIYFLIVRPSK